LSSRSIIRSISRTACLGIAAAALAQPPAIAPGGIVNSASWIPSSLPGGRLAPGARVTIPGIRFEDRDSPTSVRLEHGDWRASVKPAVLMDRSLEIVLPADTPAGGLAISVVTSRGSSRPEKVEVVASNPGIFTLNGEGWGPALRDPVRRGQRVSLRVSGLNEAHPKVFVGGLEAPSIEVHQQELSFVVPNGAPSGCWTPVWIQSSDGLIGNFATLAIEGPDGHCEQSEGWFARPSPPGRRTGLLVLERIAASVEAIPGQPRPFAFDSASAFFFRSSSKLIPLQLLPPPSSCTAYNGTFTLSYLEWFNLQRVIGPVEKMLDAGPTLAIRGPAGRTGALEPSAPQSSAQDTPRGEGFYAGMFGGQLPTWLAGAATAPERVPLFFEPGQYRLQATGSKEIGPFDVALDVPSGFEWTNQAGVKEIDRSAGVEFTWRNLAADRQMAILAFNVDTDTAALGAAICLAPPKATSMTLPAYALANFPATRPTAGLPFRLVLLVSIPVKPPEFPAPSGLDELRALMIEVQGRNVVFK
jgi:uncharacterized protein (TIGR03437 family)